MQTKTITLYNFNELDERTQEVALEKLYDINIHHEWWEFVYDDAIAIGKLIGIDIDRIYFSGFSSQGDGACFEGSYNYVKGGLAKLKAHAPLDKELHNIADGLRLLQKQSFYELSATVKQHGHYHHELCTWIDVSDEREYHYLTDDVEEAVKDSLRSFMQWIYSQLNKQYDYLTSQDAIKETIDANEYTFNLTGSIENL